jgi:hypothetical protein
MSDKYKGCQECFYYFKEHNTFPCNACERYSHYLHKDVYTESQPNQAWQAVVEGLNGTSKDDFKEDDWPDFSDNPHDVVNKPKHYMLFKSSDVATYGLTGRGIEVRDVIEKLVAKIPSSERVPYDWDETLFISDYVQMMQYGIRFMDKNGKEDLLKMRWYLDKLIEAYDA